MGRFRHGKPSAGGPGRRDGGGSNRNREDVIYGLHAIEEWLKSKPERLRVLHLDAQAGSQLREIAARARAAGVVVHAASADDISAMAEGKRHQGMVAECAPFPYIELDQVTAAPPQLVVVVDQIQDPHNLGAIMRTAEAAGAGALVAPRDNCVGVTATVEAASAGAAAWLPVCRVTNLSRALTELKDHGFWVVGLSAKAASDLFAFEPPAHVALLVGGEVGVRPLVAKQVDFELSIPMLGHTESLNASVAAAIGIYELRRKWRSS